MSRARLALLAACTLAAAAGCTSSATTSPGAQLRQPSAMAVFDGLSLHDPANLVPYLAIANAGRNDLTLVDTRSDAIVEAPLRLRPLAVPFPDRPALLVSADLGDGMADLLVGVSAGDSVLQLVRTWAPDNAILDGGTGETDELVDLGEDVLAVVALPGQPAGTARIAAALSGGGLAVASYVRSPSSEAILKGTWEVHDVGFQAIALAALVADPLVPDGGALVYAATLDPIGPGAIQGVAEIDVRGAGPWPVRALDARGPTRLVAAARLVERKRDAVEPTEAAFAGQAEVPRVYAVLDEGGCGPRRRIDCGIVALDPSKTPGPGDDHIPEDDWSDATGASWMPYRAPIRFDEVRAVALAVASPPAFRPADATYPDGYMRLQLDADSPTVTTAVGVVASEFGAIQFIDLGRFRIASAKPVPVGATATAAAPSFVDTGTEAVPNRTRLWLRDADDAFPSTSEGGAGTVGITPGYTSSASWTVSHQGILPSLGARAAEAGWDGTNLWLALQVGEGPVGAHVTSQVARLYHPALGVAAGDIVVIRNRDAAGSPICTLTPPDSTIEQVDIDFEARVAALLPPAPDRPGGAVQLVADATSAEWQACFDALLQRARDAAEPPPPTPATLVPRLLVTLRAGGLLLLRNSIQYAGRPELDRGPLEPGVDKEYVLQYRVPDGPDADTLPDGPDEDALAAVCPLADWDGVFRPLDPPPACDAACRTACETLVLARLARRVHHLSESCETAPGSVDASCDARYGAALPFLSGPALRFKVGVQVETGTTGVPEPHRLHSLTIRTQSGAEPVTDFPDGTTAQPNGALAFDPSTAGQPSDLYRFFVSYPGNQVVGVSPSVSPVGRATIR